MTCAISPMLYSWLLRQFNSWADTHHEWANNHCGQDEVCVRVCVCVWLHFLLSALQYS